MTKDGADGPGEGRGGEDLDDGLLARLRENYNPPPEPPLDAMWGRIEQDRLGRSGGEYSPRAGGRRRSTWWLGITAALIVGVALGRASANAATGRKSTPNNVLSIANSEENGNGRHRATTHASPCEGNPLVRTQ